MCYDKEIHHRRTIRLSDFDYTNGWFFVTICTASREPLLGDVHEARVDLTAYGHLAEVFWIDIPKHFPAVQLDDFVVMPNHIHGILKIERPAEVSQMASEEFGAPVGGSLATVVRSFKSATTRSINTVRETPGAPVWQKNYYERVIRNEAELAKIRRYIEANPFNWSQDPDNVATT